MSDVLDKDYTDSQKEAVEYLVENHAGKISTKGDRAIHPTVAKSLKEKDVIQEMPEDVVPDRLSGRWVCLKINPVQASKIIKK